MELLELIKRRRSVRSFKNEPIDSEKLDRIVEAAVWAPSGKNTQSWLFTVLTDKREIEQLYTAAGRALGNERYNFYDPAAFIVCSEPEDNPNGLANVSCAMQNIMLEAEEQGVGCVWINQLKDICGDPGVRAVLSSFGVPENHRVWACASLGYADALPADKPRKEGTVNRR